MRKIKSATGIPPLILIGTIIVLFPIFTFMTIDRINKQKAQSIKLLIEKSTALIRVFEASTYTGMMNMRWSSAAMENLLTETAALPDILYLFIADKNGKILLHSQKENIGKTYGRDLNLGMVIDENKIGWRILTDQKGNDVFEVHKRFSPRNQGRLMRSGPMSSMHQRVHGHNFQHLDLYKDTVIFVGLDMEAITAADRNDTQHAIMMGVILALIGLTGFILVFIVQRYSQARSSLSRIQVFSDNLVENMPVGLIATDMNNQIISINPEAAFILNLKAGFDAKALEKSILPGEIADLLENIPGKKRIMDKEILLTTNDKIQKSIDVIASPLYDNDGDSLGSLLILRDKTELYHLKDEIEQNKRLAAIGSLAAGVAHEIRNPLSSLKGYATFFKEVFDHDSENFTIADTMVKEVDRLDRVVGELGQLAKPVSVAGDRVDIGALAVEVAQLIEYEPEAAQMEIRTEIEPGLPEISADADRLKQVFLNLCINSLQAMDPPGVLKITVQKNSDSQRMIIKISDTGCGINAEDLNHIFDPYFTTKLSGTGLGLSIVHNIIKAHKGKIHVESEPGNGTRFIISLPIRIS